MKLVINIDKEEYEAYKNHLGVSYISACNKIKCGIPLEEELKKLKIEIHKLAFDDEDGDYMGLIDDDEVMKLIDNYISRLKGEN